MDIMRPPEGTPIYILGLIHNEHLTHAGELGRWTSTHGETILRAFICVVGHPYYEGKARGIELWSPDNPAPLDRNEQARVRKWILPYIRKEISRFVTQPFYAGDNIRLRRPGVAPIFGLGAQPTGWVR